MPFNITIGPSLHGSDQSSLSDEEDSSGVQVSPPSESGSHEYQDPYDGWAHLSYPDELKPSDSASRPRTSHRTRSRNPIHGSPSGSGRRHSRRQIVQERDPYIRRTRRQPSPDSPESADSAEEFAGPYGRTSQERRFLPPVAQGPNYAHSSSPGPSYVHPNSGATHGGFVHQNSIHPPSDQLIRLGHHNQAGQPSPYGHSAYPGYGPQFQHPHGPSMSPFFAHEQHPGHHTHHSQTSSHGRGDGHNSQQSLSHPVPSHGSSPYGGPPMGPHEMMPYGAGNYYPFREPYAMVPGMIPPAYFNNYPRVPSPSHVESSSSPVPAPVDVAKDEAIARLEKLILEERTEREAREAREAARQAAIEREAAEQIARNERAAHEKKIVEEAAAAARAEAEQKAAEEAAKAKKEAEEAAAAAAAEAAAAATEVANAAAAEAVAAATAAASKPPEKKKPIKFKDALGRKFSFPFDLCCTWQGMEELIRQAFLHIEVIGPHVAEGHYDLVGPNGDIILPQVWETVVEPDWTIIMHMWPIPEKPKTPEPAPPSEDPAADGATAVAASEESKKKSEAAGTKKPRPKAPDPGAFAMWMVGSSRLRANKALKVEKKPKVVQQHGVLSV